ncbi:hypothetical protein [Actinomadura sp. DC4]|nr:hypothetical protein [Actinomadura sp. DC4]MDN3355760.1 hypothetical protein [Actinomadura sp. DC4]
MINIADGRQRCPGSLRDLGRRMWFGGPFVRCHLVSATKPDPRPSALPE